MVRLRFAEIKHAKKGVQKTEWKTVKNLYSFVATGLEGGAEAKREKRKSKSKTKWN